MKVEYYSIPTKVEFTELQEVDFRADTHQYFRKGKEYLSQSKFVKIFEEAFDPQMVVRCAAAEGITVEQLQAKWDKKRNDAAAYGTMIHDNLEKAWKGQQYEPKYEMLFHECRDLIQPSKQVYPEKIFYLDEFGIAGTADLPSMRMRTRSGLFLDIFDYKTNLAKGVTLYTSTYKLEKWKHYPAQRFLGPISHLEGSLYNKYALQLSLYMYMAEQTYNIVPGRLGILAINLALRMNVIPVPYMKREIESMLQFYSELKAA